MARDGMTALRYRVESEANRKRWETAIKEMARLQLAGNTEAVNLGLLALGITPAEWEQAMRLADRKKLEAEG